MGVRQHYYTSYMNRITGNAGFQVKAMSPGITPDVQALIARLIAYRIPPSLDEHALNTHPVALRYYYGGPHMGILLCSQSNDTDDNGRPGNFFAHTLLLDPNTLASVPPIFYWRSPFWRKEDREVRSSVASLPVLTSFEPEVLLEEDHIWQFFKEDERRYELLYKLLCAVVHSTKTQRRIVILDTTEHVALWIASVSCLLPPAYRPLLTFATYHHDPYQAQYLITGTTTDAGFHATPEEYLSFFILNAQTGATSEVEDSSYAKMAVAFVRNGLYDTELLDVFTNYAPFFPEPKALDEQLELLAAYADMRKNPPKEALNAPQLQAIQTVVVTLKKSVTTARPVGEAFERAVQELNALVITLREAFNVSRDLAAQEQFHNIVASMRVRGLPVNDFILYEIKVITERLLFENAQREALTTLRSLRSDYDDKTIVDIINSADYLESLDFRRLTSGQQRVFWRHLGEYLRPQEQCQDILLASFETLHRLSTSGRKDDMHNLLNAMCGIMRGQGLAWMRLAVQVYRAASLEILVYFYYDMVHMLALDQRVPYRDEIRKVYPGIASYELNNDLCHAVREQEISTLEEWISHAGRYGDDKASLLKEGWVYLCKKDVSARHKQVLARQILTNELLAPLLPQELESELVQQVASSLSFSNFDAKDHALYEKCRNHPALSAQTSLIIRGINAIVGGQLDRRLAEEIAASWRGVDELQYRAMVARCLPTFFSNDVSPEAHRSLFWAFFPASPEDPAADAFWEEYSLTFTKMLSSPQSMHKIVQLFDFWFEARPAYFRPSSYVLQNFFLYLPYFYFVNRQTGFKSIQQNPDFDKYARQRPWFSSVQSLHLPRKSFAKAMISNVAGAATTLLQRSKKDDGAVQEKGKQTGDIEAEIAQLFNSRRAVEETHRERLAKLYQRYPQEEFWPHLYWKGLTAVLHAQDVETVLAVLAFWFDESFEKFGHISYMPQQFFWWLPRWLKEVNEKQELSRVVKTVYRKARSAEARYPWHPLLGKILTGEKS